MKKSFHHGLSAIIAFAVITVSSCSKSTNDLIVNKKKSEKEVVLSSQGKKSISPGAEDGWSSIYPFINEPVTLKLGDPDNNLYTGDQVVFYFTASDEFRSQLVSSATLSLVDDNKSESIQEYSLIAADQADLYEITVPGELVGKLFMFAIIDLDDRYTDRVISMHSTITANDKTTVAQLDQAFTVRAN